MSISRTLVILALASTPAVPMAQAAETVPVQAGDAPITFRPTVEKDSLWVIATETVPFNKVSVNQAMVSILRRNPDAFVRGNLHMLRKGVVLTIPSIAQMQAEDRAKSDALVADHQRLLVEKNPAPAPLYELSGKPVTPGTQKPVQPAQLEARTSTPKPADRPASAATNTAPPPSSRPASTTASSSGDKTEAPPQQKVAPVAPTLPSSAPKTQPTTAPAPSQPAATAPAPTASASPAENQPNWFPLIAGATGLALLGAALWAWRFTSPSRPSKSGASTPPESDDRITPKLPQISNAAMDTARSVDAMKPALELVHKDGETASLAPDQEKSASRVTLKLQMARTYVELRRFDEAYILLQDVAMLGTAEEQQEAQELLKGSN